MPIYYHIEPELHLLMYLGMGLCTGQELLQAERSAFHNELRKPGLKIIIDIQLAEIDFDLNDIRELIGRNRHLYKEGFKLEQTAIVTRSSRFGNFGEVFRILANELPINLGMFHNIPDAIEWLAIFDANEQILQIQKSLKDSSTRNKN